MMTDAYLIPTKMLLALYTQQMTLQAQLIDAQREIIALQEKIIQSKPETPPDDEVFWHLASDGVLSTEAAQSDDVDVVKKLMEWNYSLAEKHVKPHVDPKVYIEVVNQMTRGLSNRVSALQTTQEAQPQSVTSETPQTDKRMIQLALIKDA
jgi:hypothetical protein